MITLKLDTRKGSSQERILKREVLIKLGEFRSHNQSEKKCESRRWHALKKRKGLLALLSFLEGNYECLRALSFISPF